MFLGLLLLRLDNLRIDAVINVLKMLILRQCENPFVYPPDLLRKVVMEDPKSVLSGVKDHRANLMVYIPSQVALFVPVVNQNSPFRVIF